MSVWPNCFLTTLSWLAALQKLRGQHPVLPKLPRRGSCLRIGKDWWLGLSVSESTFVATVSKEHPEKFQGLLAYHATVLIEALRFGCKGWLSYDKIFREHMEKEPNSSWSMLHPMFYSLSFLSQRVEALTCPRCISPDHSKSELMCFVFAGTYPGAVS